MSPSIPLWLPINVGYGLSPVPIIPSSNDIAIFHVSTVIFHVVITLFHIAIDTTITLYILIAIPIPPLSLYILLSFHTSYSSLLSLPTVNLSTPVTL